MAIAEVLQEGTFFLSLKGSAKKTNSIVSLVQAKPNSIVLGKSGLLGNRKVSLIHDGGEAHFGRPGALGVLESEELYTHPLVERYIMVDTAKVDVIYFASSLTGREKFLTQLKIKIPTAGYDFKRQEWVDTIVRNGREFKAEYSYDYRFKGTIENKDPFELMKFLGEYSPCKLSRRSIRLFDYDGKVVVRI